jgi:Tfp pilus assembly protein FimT
MSSTPARRLALRKGVTLVELALVAVVTGVILGMVAPRLTTVRGRLQLDSTAHGLARDLGRARMDAVKRNAQVTLTLVGDTGYVIGTEKAHRLPSGLVFNLSESVTSVTFNPFGPVAAGSGHIRLASGDYERRVKIRNSGHVSVE